MRVHDLETISAQEKGQPEHLVNPVWGIESALWVELTHRNRRAFQFLEKWPARTQAAQCHVILIGAEPGREFDSLDLGPADIQGIEEIEHFPPTEGP